MNNMVSIIVPVYNASKFLNQCVMSLREQSYENLQIILIDDQSSDDSLDILHKHGSEDNRIDIISLKENVGQSMARNIGLKKAVGAYISFCDADDWLHPDFIQTMVSLIEEENVDIALCDYNINGVSCESSWDRKKIVGNEKILEFFYDSGVYNRIMNKVYCRKVIEGIMFPKDRNLKEDACWTANVLARTDSLIRIPDGLYNYRIVNISTSHKKNKPKKLLIGMYRNDLEKYNCLLNGINDKTYRIKIAADLCALMREIILYDYDSNEIRNWDYIKDISCQHSSILSETDKEIINVISSSKNKNTAFRKLILCYLKSLKFRKILTGLYYRVKL